MSLQSRLTIALLVMLVTPLYSMPVSAQDISWSDNFDDENADGWVLSGYHWNETPPNPWEGNLSVDDGVLKSPDDLAEPYWNLASHENEVSIGTWSFDIYVVDTSGGHIHVYFMTDDWSRFPTYIYGYDLFVVTRYFPDLMGTGIEYSAGFFLLRRNGHYDAWDNLGRWRVLANYTGHGDIYGWHSFDITRSADGMWNVYINDTLCMTAADDAVEYSSYFRFICEGGPALDNVGVSGIPGPLTKTPTDTTPDSTPTTSEPTPLQIPLEILAAAIAIPVVAVVLIVAIRRRRG